MIPAGLAPGGDRIEMRGTDAQGNEVVETHVLAVGDTRSSVGAEEEGFVFTNLHLVVLLGLGALAMGGLVALRRRS